MTRALDTALTQAGIPHTFEVYPGEVVNMLEQRMGSAVLPFLSAALEGGARPAIGRP